MKKILLSAATLLFVGTAFAQTNVYNESKVVATGINTGVILQNLGMGVANYSDMTQTGTNNADVNQIGGNNSVIVQTGATNDADIDQVGVMAIMRNASDVTQLGSSQDAVVHQVGAANSSIINQVNAGGIVTYINTAIVQQGTLSPSALNESDIDQANEGNITTHQQNGFGNRATSQQGSTNAAVPIGMGLYLQTVVTTQTGERNLAVVTQNGDNNSSVVTQSAALGNINGPYTNNATVMQAGDGNSSVVTQADTVAMVPDANSTVTVMQTNNVMGTVGIVNFSNVNQVGTSTWSVTQTNN